MLRRINFFALRTDLIAVLQAVEFKRPVKYVLSHDSSSSRLQEWFRAADIPELGQAACEQSIGCKMFLLADWNTEVQVRPFQLISGETRFAVDQMRNQDSIVINPAGQWKPDIIISGFFATVSDTSTSQSLMRLLARVVRGHFTRIGAFWVGPEAMIGFRHGYRLTQAEQSPAEFDLRG